MVGPNGEQVGIVRVEDALRLAAEADLDLVEVAPMAKPPVAKLMDFGKFKYEAAMKAREARKNQVNTVIKEIKLRPKIDPHDYGTKKGHVVRFLGGGDKVKVTIMFRGREQSRPELGFRLLQRLAEDVVELGTVESAPKQDGRNMVMVLAPTKKKAQAMAEQRKRRDDAKADHERPRPAEPGEARSRRPSRARPPRAPRAPARADPEAPPAPLTAHERKEIGTMPKNKTHSGAKKRFRVTGSGKVMREQAGHVHKFHEKTPQKARALSKDVLVSKGDLKKVNKLLGR